MAKPVIFFLSNFDVHKLVLFSVYKLGFNFNKCFAPNAHLSHPKPNFYATKKLLKSWA